MKKIFLAVITILAILTSRAQTKNYTLPQVVPKSPDVAAFEKYGNVPVSLSTGMANVSVPLTTIELGKFSLPITLSYYNNGLKVDEIPSCVGLGWSLQAGGMVSFEQRGVDDFKSGGMFASSALTDLSKYFSGTMTADERYWFLERIMNGEQDSEYDLYHFNFLGQSGSFYFDNTQTPVLMPKADLKISKITNGIKVVDHLGNQFFFDVPEASQMYSALEVEIRPNFNSTSAYYLSKIVTVDNRVISFKYKSYYLQYNKVNQVITHNTSANVIPECPPSSMNYFDTYVYQEYLLPDSILFDQGYVKFLHSGAVREDLKKLNANVPSITGFFMANTANQRLKEFSFTQGYFGSNDRLKLVAVREVKGSTINRKWDFDYYETAGFPAFFSKAKDHWGFANGVDNLSLIPDIDYSNMLANWRNYSVPFGNRSSSSQASLTGMLKKIEYPTGGSSVFEYEPNQVKWQSNSQPLGMPFLQAGFNSSIVQLGGANTLNDPDGDGVLEGTITLSSDGYYIVKTFTELDPTHFEDPLYYFTGPSANEIAKGFALNCTQYQCGSERRAFLHAGVYTYRLVAGRWYNPETLSYYPRHINFEIAGITLGPPVPCVLGGNRIARITNNDSTGITPQVVKKFIYADSIQHVVFRGEPYYMTRMDRRVLGSSQLYCIDCGTEYSIHDENVKPPSGNLIEYQYVTEYDSSITGLLGKTEHTFRLSVDDAGNNGQPYVPPINTSWRTGTVAVDRVYKNSGGSPELLREVQNTYYNSPDNLNKINGIKVDYAAYCTGSSPMMRAHNIGLSTLFTEQYYLSASKQTDYLQPQSIVSQQNITANSAFHTFPVLNSIINSEGQPVTEKNIYSSDYNIVIAPSTEAQGVKLLNTLNMIVPVEVVKIRNSGGTDYVVGGSLTTYKPDAPVIDKIYHLKIDVPVALASFVQSSITNGNLVKDSRYELRYSFDAYDEYNNIITLRLSDNIPVSYIWDYHKLYPVAEVKNAVAADVAYTSFEADQKGGWTFTGTPVADDVVPTGEKSYNLVNGAISKTGLKSAVTYIVSYWTKNAAPYTIAGTQAGYPLAGRSVNGWINYTHKVTGVTNIVFPASGYIDELRLYPADASMTTYTYREHVGVSSSCNEQNQITYYDYDDFNRLKLVKDQNGKIVRQHDYQYQKPVTQ